MDELRIYSPDSSRILRTDVSLPRRTALPTAVPERQRPVITRCAEAMLGRYAAMDLPIAERIEALRSVHENRGLGTVDSLDEWGHAGNMVMH